MKNKAIFILLIVLTSITTSGQETEPAPSLTYGLDTEFTDRAQNSLDSVFVTVLTIHYTTVSELAHIKIALDANTVVGYKGLAAYAESREEDKVNNIATVRLANVSPGYPLVFVEKENGKSSQAAFRNKDGKINNNGMNRGRTPESFEPDSSRYFKGPKPVKPHKNDL